MTTKIIGIKEFRANISRYAQEAQKGEARYIIMNRNNPLFELKPFDEDADFEDIFTEIKKAEEDITKGRIYTQEEILAEFA